MLKLDSREQLIFTKHKLRKIHIHTDCEFFAGCENMLPILLNSKEISSIYKTTLSYRYSDRYFASLRMKADITRCYPVKFPYFINKEWLPSFIPYDMKRGIMLAIRVLLHYPLFMYEVLVLIAMFKRISPDILHINNGGYPGTLSARAAVVSARLLGIKHIVMVVNNQAVPYFCNPKRIFLDYFIDRLVVKSCQYYVTGSDSSRKKLASVLGLEESCTVAIPNTIILPSCKINAKRSYKSDGSPIKFGVVANLEKRKGHPILFDAIRLIAKRNPEIKFSVALEGSGPEREKLLALSTSYGIDGYINFVGRVDDIYSFYNEIDVLILPSIEGEDFPNVILEAMAQGIPVIGTRVAGIPEQIDNNLTGKVVNPYDSYGLSQEIEYFAQHKYDAQSMGNLSISKFNRVYAPSVCINSYLRLYSKMEG